MGKWQESAVTFGELLTGEAIGAYAPTQPMLQALTAAGTPTASTFSFRLWKPAWAPAMGAGENSPGNTPAVGVPAEAAGVKLPQPLLQEPLRSPPLK